MAKKPQVQMLSKGAIALLKGSAVRADLLARAERVAAAAGPGFDASVKYGRTRNLASVTATTDEARAAEASDRALTRAIGAAQ